MSKFKDQSLLEQYRVRCEALGRENAALRVEVATLRANVAVMQKRVDHAEREWSVAKAEEDGAATELVRAHAKVDSLVVEAAELRAGLASAQAQLNAIAAPRDATVGSLPKDLG